MAPKSQHVGAIASVSPLHRARVQPASNKSHAHSDWFLGKQRWLNWPWSDPLYSAPSPCCTTARTRDIIRNARIRIKHAFVCRCPARPPTPWPARPLARPPTRPPEHRTHPLDCSPARRISRWRALGAWQADANAGSGMSPLAGSHPTARQTHLATARPSARPPACLIAPWTGCPLAWHARLPPPTSLEPTNPPARPRPRTPARPLYLSLSLSPAFTAPPVRTPARPLARPLHLARSSARTPRHPAYLADGRFSRLRALEAWQAGATDASWLLQLAESHGAYGRRERVGCGGVCAGAACRGGSRAGRTHGQ